MRLISFSVALALLSSASFAQQAPGTTSDKTASPPPSEPASKGYTGAYGPPGPATPYYTGPLPEVYPSTGRSVEGPNNTTLIVKAVPCTVAARSTDGSTTCVGIPDSFRKNRH
jgi:hypothetical protein